MSQVRCSEQQDGCGDEVGPGHTFRVVQISRTLQGCLGTCAHCGAGIRSNEIEAQTSHDGTGVMVIQTVEGEAVVKQGRRLEKHLTSHLEIHLGPCLSRS